MSTRIIVTNFDAITQADLWLTNGHERATAMLLGILRTALLLGGELVIDRNQLFDGVFFLSLGPHRIARELGLAAGTPLPITVNCSPEPFAGPEEAPTGSRTVHVGRNPHSPGTVSIGRQLADVREPRFLASSSALRGLLGQERLHPWMAPAAGPQWYPGAGFVDLLHPLRRTEEERALELIRRAQEPWARAAETGEVAVQDWTARLDLRQALAGEQARLHRIAADGEQPAALAMSVLSGGGHRRGDIVEEISQWCEGDGVADAERRLALQLWSRAYYQAIAWANDAMLISFDTSDYATDPGGADLARRYGFTTPPTPTWRQRLTLRRTSPRADGRVSVEGEIIDHLRDIDPGTYRRLALSNRHVVASIVERRDAADMYDLALACRRAVDVGLTHRQARFASGLKVVTMTGLAALVAVLTLAQTFVHVGSVVQAFLVVAVVLLGVFAGMPWDAIVTRLSLRASSMTAVVNVKDAP